MGDSADMIINGILDSNGEYIGQKMSKKDL